MALKSSWMQSNFKPWCSVDIGNASVPEEPSQCSNSPPWPACQRNWPISLSPPIALSGKVGGMTSHPNLDQLNPEELHALAAQLIQRVETMDKQINHQKSVNEKLAHEIALIKRFNFARPLASHFFLCSPRPALDLGDLFNFYDLCTFTQHIPIDWVASALNLYSQATIRRRRLPAE